MGGARLRGGRFGRPPAEQTSDGDRDEDGRASGVLVAPADGGPQRLARRVWGVELPRGHLGEVGGAARGSDVGRRAPGAAGVVRRGHERTGFYGPSPDAGTGTDRRREGARTPPP